MIISPHVQGSFEWMQDRSGIPTASELHRLVTPKGKVKTGDGPRTYLCEKVAEYWQGGPLPAYCSVDMDIGQMLEERAKPWYSITYDQPIQSVGLCLTDDGRVGASPDGLIGEEGGIEIKCPARHTHTRYLLDGELPEDYVLQVHGCMYVTGRAWWKFLSYDSLFPKLVLHIERDEKMQAAIAEALAGFLEQFDAAVKRMEEINEGPCPQPRPTEIQREYERTRAPRPVQPEIQITRMDPPGGAGDVGF